MQCPAPFLEILAKPVPASTHEERHWHALHWERPSPAAPAEDLEYFLRRPSSPLPNWMAANFAR